MGRRSIRWCDWSSLARSSRPTADIRHPLKTTRGAPAQGISANQLPLVGRDSEMQLIASLLRDARKGAGKTLIVSGEGGVGKTRILTEASARARQDGWNVVTGRAYAVETGIPYALFSDALLPFIRSLEPGTLAVLTRGGAAELAYLFPALGSSGDRE